jgi:hypothetical protein
MMQPSSALVGAPPRNERYPTGDRQQDEQCNSLLGPLTDPRSRDHGRRLTDYFTVSVIEVH